MAFPSRSLNWAMERLARVTTGFSLAPWTRDQGQMVRSPVDLYDSLEKPLMHCWN